VVENTFIGKGNTGSETFIAKVVCYEGAIAEAEVQRLRKVTEN